MPKLRTTINNATTDPSENLWDDDPWADVTSVSSWTSDAGLADVLAGKRKPTLPTLFEREDGRFMLYPGRIHTVSGEPESGKSWVNAYLTDERIRRRERVAYLDYESDADTMVERLIALGLSTEQIRAGLIYRCPEEPPTGPNFEAFLREADGCALAILDGVTEALATSGASTNDNDEVTAWGRRYPKRLARATGAAVVLSDHVTKSTEGRGRFPIGAQAKMAVLTGASYSIEVVRPLGVGLVGELELRIGKDRPGKVRPYCGAWRAGDRTQVAARLLFDARGLSQQPAMVVQVCKPSGADDPDKNKPFRPTHLMEEVSRFIESNSGCSQKAVVDGTKGREKTIVEAVRILTQEGYVEVRKVGVASHHGSLRPYRADGDQM